MASRTSRKVCSLGRPWASGTGRWGLRQDHSASERSLWYAFLMLGILPSERLRTPFQTVSRRSSVRVASHRSYRTRTAGEEDPTAACSHTNLPKEYAATSDAHRNDTAQPHARRRIPAFALSVATSTLTKAHNREPTNNATHGSSTGVGGGIGPVLPMFLAASAKQTNDVPTTHGHHTLTESSSLGGSPPRTSYTYRSTSHGKTALCDLRRKSLLSTWLNSAWKAIPRRSLAVAK